MNYFFDVFGLIGLIIFGISFIKKDASWSPFLRKLGNILMAIYIIREAGMGLYDGFMLNPHK